MTTPIGIYVMGPRTWASSRIRGWWLQDCAPDMVTVYGPGDDLSTLSSHQVVVFQKRQSEADWTRANMLKAEGVTVVYDLTDPLWWMTPGETHNMLRVADIVTVSSEGLREALSSHPDIARLEYIPDRMLPQYHPKPARHGERDKPVLVWFGQSVNRLGLMGMIPVLQGLGWFHPFTLRIVDDKPHLHMANYDALPFDVEHVPWSLDRFHHILTTSDVALCPPYPGLWGRLKSPNKQVTAWWCGLPTVDGLDLAHLETFATDHQVRTEVGKRVRDEAESNWSTQHTIAQWRTILASL